MRKEKKGFYVEHESAHGKHEWSNTEAMCKRRPKLYSTQRSITRTYGSPILLSKPGFKDSPVYFPSISISAVEDPRKISEGKLPSVP